MNRQSMILGITLSVFSGLFVSPPPAHAIDAPFVHYKMDDNAPSLTVIDSGSGGQDAIATSNTDILSVAGQKDSAFDFQGTDRLDISAFGNQIKNDQIGTVVFWMKPVIATDAIFVLGASTADTHFVFRIIYGKIEAVAQHNVTRVVQARGTTVLPLGQWVHCAYVQDGTQMRIYINGVEETVDFAPNDDWGAWLGDVNGSGQIDRFVLGGTNSAGTGNTFFSGSMDDFRYYRRALSAEEVQTLYSGETIEPVVSVKSYQKISSTEGNLIGPLADTGGFGRSVTWLGNLGPGAPTPRAVAVGNPFFQNGLGYIWILFLNTDGTVAVEQRIANGSGGLPEGTLNANLFGVAIASLGDIDGDGVVDIAVGESNFFAGNSKGAAWILRLNSNGTVKAYQKIAEGFGGFPAGALDMNDDFGNALALLGDLNNDGFKELAVGAPGDDDGTGQPVGLSQAGAIWILSLTSTGMVNSYQKISQLSGNGPDLGNNDLLGTSLAWLGNLGPQAPTPNALAVGAIFDEEVGVERGAAYILFLNNNGTVNAYQKINELHGNFAGALDDFDRFGISMGTIGDMDGDSVSDLAVGAYLDNDGGDRRGAVWLLLLNPDGTVKARQKISDISGGFTGAMDDVDQFGVSISSLGDFNTDGIIDIAVGAQRDDDGGIDRGAIWILFLDSPLGNRRHVININAQVNGHPDFGHAPLIVPLTAGKYELTFINPDINPDALYSAWSANNASVVWRTAYKFLSADIPVALGSGGVFPEASTAHEAFDLTMPKRMHFSLPENQDIRFYIGDHIVYDNLGGVSLLLQKVDNLGPIANAGLNQSAHYGATVMMDASESSDPDMNHPLTFFWTIAKSPADPEGCTVDLTNASDMTPVFTAPFFDCTYTLSLVVTDSLGKTSEPVNAVVSTYNTPPIADAGDDLPASYIGQILSLNGLESYDPDGDAISYLWSVISPANSNHVIDNPVSPTPQITIEQHTNYEFRLTVEDEFGVQSNTATDIASVLISFENIAPVARAGGNLSINVFETAVLDGSGSSDVNNDPLTYQWCLVNKPDGSKVSLACTFSHSPLAQIVPDLHGEYVAQLIVNDSFVDSPPATARITAASTGNAVIQKLQEAIGVINNLNPEVFKNSNLVNALTNKINAAIMDVQNGNYQDALGKLQNDIIRKTNGCVDNGQPDKNDWISVNDPNSSLDPCEDGQFLVYHLLQLSVVFLSDLI